MSFRLLSLVASICMINISCQKVETDREKLSYARGFQAGKQLKNEGVEMDAKAYILGFQAGFSKEDQKVKQYLSESEMIVVENKSREDQSKSFGERMQKNKIEGETLLQTNQKNPEIKTTASGLQYQVLTLGAGPKPQATDQVKAFSVGQQLNGKLFENFPNQGQPPPTFLIKNQLPGWQEGIQLMPVGSKFKFFIPPSLAYGSSMRGEMLPYSVLIYEVELVEILKPEPPKVPAAEPKKK